MSLAGQDYLTQKELAFELGVSVRALRVYRRRWPRELKPLRAIGGQLLFDPSAAKVAAELVTRRAFKRYGIAA